MVWNQDGQVWSAYYDPVAKHRVDAGAFPGVAGDNDFQDVVISLRVHDLFI